MRGFHFLTADDSTARSHGASRRGFSGPGLFARIFGVGIGRLSYIRMSRCNKGGFPASPFDIMAARLHRCAGRSNGSPRRSGLVS